MARIFISYKRVDKEKVFKIKDLIESKIGEKCWIDLDGIESDAQFKNVIIKAINNCEIVLFMYSKSHAKIMDFEKDWTVRELNFAATKNKRIVFINIDGSPLTDEFAFDYGTKQQVNALDESAIDRLIKDISKWLEITQAALPVPRINVANHATNTTQKNALNEPSTLARHPNSTFQKVWLWLALIVHGVVVLMSISQYFLGMSHLLIMTIFTIIAAIGVWGDMHPERASVFSLHGTSITIISNMLTVVVIGSIYKWRQIDIGFATLMTICMSLHFIVMKIGISTTRRQGK